jgi:N-acetylmuramoyl-L-alanine amidase
MNIINKIGQYKNAPWWQRNVGEINYIVVHHSASKMRDDEEAMLQDHANYHINNNGWQGLSYHYIIGKSGTIYQINDLTDITWTDGLNRESLAICLDGYFHPDVNEKPTDAQIKAMEELLDELVTNHPEFPAGQSNVVAHRDHSAEATACCGDILYPLVTNYRNTGYPNGAPTPEPTPQPEPTPTPADPCQECKDRLTGWDKYALNMVLTNNSKEPPDIWKDRVLPKYPDIHKAVSDDDLMYIINEYIKLKSNENIIKPIETPVPVVIIKDTQETLNALEDARLQIDKLAEQLNSKESINIAKFILGTFKNGGVEGFLVAMMNVGFAIFAIQYPDYSQLITILAGITTTSFLPSIFAKAKRFTIKNTK